MDETQTATKYRDISEVLLDEDVEQSLVTLLEQLPKLTSIISMASTAAGLLQEAVTDPELMDIAKDMTKEKLAPLQSRWLEAKEILRDTRLQAEQDTAYIGVFGLLRILKDPQVQKSLRYIQAFLRTLEARQSAQHSR